jgi:hypothetical protein
MDSTNSIYKIPSNHSCSRDFNVGYNFQYLVKFLTNSTWHFSGADKFLYLVNFLSNFSMHFNA